MAFHKKEIRDIGSCVWGVLVVVLVLGLIAAVLYMIIGLAIDFSNLPHVTVSLIDARGLDVDEKTRATPVEFDVAIGFLHLTRDLAAGHDGGHVTISYDGVKLAEGHVPKFYVAGGPKKRVEATRAVASAGKDQAPLSQMFREHLWVDQQLDGEAVFDVALSFYDVNVTTAEIRREYHYCKVGFPLHGKAKATKCGEPEYLFNRQ